MLRELKGSNLQMKDPKEDKLSLIVMVLLTQVLLLLQITQIVPPLIQQVALIEIQHNLTGAHQRIRQVLLMLQ